jgi:DNA-binding NarL/FixJ family response regulator
MIRIVIIEDLPLILEGIKVLINQIDDLEVVGEFQNGQEFIDALPEVDADIILTDINMPVLDGVAMTKLALVHDPEMKIIALSMYNDAKYYYEMITAGAKGFVLKQASVEELETAIREVHNEGSFFSQELLHGVIMGMQTIEKELAAEKQNLLKLSDREVQLLELICQGKTNKQLAEALHISVKTVESHKAQLMKKTKTANNAGLIIWAVKNKVVLI